MCLLPRRHFNLLALAALTGLPAAAQVRDLHDAINKAGHQRMLSQRSAKAYLALALAPQAAQAPQAARILDQSLALFDRQLVELKAFAPSPAVRDTYVRLESAWADYKEELVGRPPAMAGAPAVLAQSERVLALAQQGTTQLQQASGKASGQLVNLAGRQRMLSQRLAKYCYAAAARLDPAGARAEIAQARTEFVAGMRTLTQAPEATPRIRQQLQLGEQQWVFFEAALQAVQKAAVTPEALAAVLTTSENILTVLDDVTRLYASLA